MAMKASATLKLITSAAHNDNVNSTHPHCYQATMYNCLENFSAEKSDRKCELTCLISMVQ